MARKRILAVVLLTLCSAALGLIANIAAANLPSWMKPYLPLAWPLLGTLVAVSIALLLSQAALGSHSSATALLASNRSRTRKPAGVFISYAREDSMWRDSLRRLLERPCWRFGISVWDDTNIPAGQHWRKQIDEKLASAGVAVVIISEHYFQSSFILTSELPALLDAAEHRGLTLLAVIASDAPSYRQSKLSEYQAINNPDRPMTRMGAREASRELARIAADIGRLTTPARWPPPLCLSLLLSSICILAGIAGFVWWRSTAPPTPPPPEGSPRPDSMSPPNASKFWNRVDEQIYCRIPAGTLLMGCSDGDDDCRPEERPEHKVVISNSFLIGSTEVTNAAFRRYELDRNGVPPSGASNVPALVDWKSAAKFCSWAGGSLPTEAQWELAARAGETGPRYGQIDAVAWYGANTSGIKPVALRQANAWGLFDVLGNASEWTRDTWDERFYDHPQSVRDPISVGGDDKEKVVRGGSWHDGAVSLRFSAREPRNATATDYGFRCVLPVSSGNVIPYSKPVPANLR